MRLISCLIILLAVSVSQTIGEASAEATSTIFGNGEQEACVSCHPGAVQAWRGSDHARALQHASVATVLGDFDDVTLARSGEQIQFSRDGNAFHVAISQSVSNDKPEVFRILYTFGIRPLQQYLVEIGKGKLQALPWAWDTRAASEGGQRWFHLYGDEDTPPGDRLHWRSPLQNWNGMCADCHSTGFERAYDPVGDTFSSVATATGISCASCHGEASGHVAAMQRGKTSTTNYKDIIRFLDASTSQFKRDDGAPTASNVGASHKGQEVDVCASCHARRTPLTAAIDPARSFPDQFTPALLEDGLYYADGQIHDEVYVWGSFRQSKMAAAGVTCSHCHDAHSLELKARGNALCTTCHAPQVFDTASHHRHDPASNGSQCTNCHMPQTTYMGVDARRDHSFKIPRPDVSARIGTPNACTGCHAEMSNEAAAELITDWHGPERGPSFAETLHGARNRDPAAREPLARLIENEAQPVIVRASALGLVAGVRDGALIDLAAMQLSSKEPLLRLGAIAALSLLSPERRATLLAPLLDDEIKAVRLEAATAMIDIPPNLMAKETAVRLGVVADELLVANEQIAWRAEGRLNRGLIYQSRGDREAAAATYEEAIRIDPAFAPPYVNLSELLRAEGKQDDAMEVLTRALAATRGGASVHHAMGLALIRRNQHAEALDHFKNAATLAPGSARFAYVYAVALDSLERRGEAIAQLEAALVRHPHDVDLLNLGLAIASQERDFAAIRSHAKRLAAIFPDEASYKDLLAQPDN